MCYPFCPADDPAHPLAAFRDCRRCARAACRSEIVDVQSAEALDQLLLLCRGHGQPADVRPPEARHGEQGGDIGDVALVEYHSLERRVVDEGRQVGYGLTTTG